jgi:ketosteroid isomerase-like protein
MSEENLEIVRSAYDVPYGGDEWLVRVDTYVAADFELEDRTLPGVAQGLKGPEAMRAEAAHMREVFEDVSYAVEDLVDLDDRVLVRLRGSGRGKGSGIRVDGTLGHLWRLRAGKVVRVDVYGTWQEALEAAGLSE